MMEGIKHLVRKYQRFIKYSVAGAFNTAIDYAAFIISYELFEIPIEYSQFIGLFCGSVNGYLLNSNITFREGKGRTRAQFFQYLGIDLLLALITSQALGVAEKNDMPIYVFKVLSTVFITVVHYIAFKYVVFKIKKEDTRE